MPKLCINCLEVHDERDLEIGPDRGSQRDPYRDRLSLCATCRDALLSASLTIFAQRFRAERTVSRDEPIHGP